MIQDSSESALFWLYLSALSFIRDLSGEDSSDGSSHVSVPLSNVLAWTRGSAPIFTSDEEGPPIVRLTSDCRGLKRVERLDSKPLYQDWRSDTMEFAIQDANLIQSVIAQFKVSLPTVPNCAYCFVSNTCAIVQHLTPRDAGHQPWVPYMGYA
jgi:hypothetical protein